MSSPSTRSPPACPASGDGPARRPRLPERSLTDPTRVERFRAARRDPALAVLEGIHPLKHALRFGARVVEAVSPDPERIAALARDLAPDVAPRIEALLRVVPEEVFVELAPAPPTSGVLALAHRPRQDLRAALAHTGSAPVVLLDRPTHLGNIGAVVRVAAAAGAAAVVTTGPNDPWHPAALRGGAGLQYALPVARLDAARFASPGELPVATAAALPPFGRTVVALDPDGDPLEDVSLPARAILAFGSERRGLAAWILDAADRRVAIPMRAGVSSLNLATAAAVVLYARRREPRDG